MGYLTNSGYLRDLEDLYPHLPEGWTFNTPCVVYYEELEYFREVSHSNELFMEMLATGRSIYQVLNGPTWKPCAAEILREQKIAAEQWAEALDDELGGWYRYHPHESGAYIHTMWARANDREEAYQAIFAVDMCPNSTQEFKDQFCSWVREMVDEQRARVTKVSRTWQSDAKHAHGLAARVYAASNGLSYTTRARKWTRVTNAGRKRRGSTLADKRRGVQMHSQRSKTQWR